MHAKAARRGTALGLTSVVAIYGLVLVVMALVNDDDPAASSFLACQPLVAGLLMWPLLRRRCATGSADASVLAWMLGTLFVLIAATETNWGLFLLPAALLLLLAVWLAPIGPPATAEPAVPRGLRA